ncbi:MAG: right-handed parallel beta-helix repeat-containing protein [Cryobacterium sp.]|nr:right-handed parallel beta-helix repeat-containing protein [Cryobacterium sp.]
MIRPQNARILSVATVSTLTAGVLLVVAAPASAADLGTASTEAQLVTLINTANGDAAADSITLTGSGFTLTADLPTITNPLTITGPGSSLFTLDAATFDAFNDFAVTSSFSLTGVKIINAGSTNSVCAIRSQAVSLTLSDVIVDSSYCGVRSVDTTVSISNSSFSNNATQGISIDVSGTATIANVSLLANGNDGLIASLYTAGSLSISDSESSGSTNDDGFYIEASDDTAVTLTNNIANNNDNRGLNLVLGDNAVFNSVGFHAESNNDEGVYAYLSSSSSATFTNTYVFDSQDEDGIGIETTDSSSATLTNTTSNENDSDGMQCDADVFSSITVTGFTGNGNDADGLDVSAYGSATVTVSNANVDSNVDNGLEVDAEGPLAVSTVTGSTSSNSSNGVGAQLQSGNGGQVELNNSNIRNNSVRGVLISSNDPGTDGDVTIKSTTIRDNGDGSEDGTGVLVDDVDGLTVDIDSSTISGNQGDMGGGIYLRLDDNEFLSLTVVNSTIAGNTASIVAGMYADQDVTPNPSTLIRVLNSTIANNITTDDGPGGLALTGDIPAEVRNSIVSGNTTPSSYGDFDVMSTNVNVDYSLVQVPSTDAAIVVAAGTGNLVGVDPQLGPLANNGGPTFTMLPGDTSSAVNAGEPGFAGATYDQRGLTRVINGLDMGAVELQAELPATGANPLLPLAIGFGLLLLGAAALRIRKVG